jgi:hypothetical protein
MAKEQTVSLYNGRAIATMDRWHRYFVTIPELNKTRIYQPGVTTIIGMKDKSGPLQWWAVDCALEYIKQGLDELQEAMTINFGAEAKLTQVSVEWLLQKMPEAQRNYRNVKKAAAEIGNLVHDFNLAYMEWLHYGKQRPGRPKHDVFSKYTKEQIEKANNGIDASLKFFTEHELKPITMEKPVWSPTYGIVGTDDFIGYVDDELCCLDYKTGKDIYPEVFMQISAYATAYEEENPTQIIEAGWALNTNKETGEFNAIRRPAAFFAEDFRGFLGLRDTFMWDRVHGREPKDAIQIVGALPKLKKSGKKKALVTTA